MSIVLCAARCEYLLNSGLYGAFVRYLFLYVKSIITSFAWVDARMAGLLLCLLLGAVKAGLLSFAFTATDGRGLAIKGL